MSNERSSSFFYQLVLRHHLGFVTTEHPTVDSSTTGLWIQAKENDFLPFWRLLDIKEHAKPKNLLTKLPDLLKLFKQQPTFFSSDVDRWLAILEPLSKEKWFQPKTASHAAIRHILNYSLTPLCEAPLKKIKQLVHASDLPKKNEGLTYIKQAERYHDCTQIELLAKWVLSRLQDAPKYTETNQHLCSEIGMVFIPFYMQTVYFKLFCFYILKTYGQASDPVSINRIQLSLEQTLFECNGDEGLAKELLSYYIQLSDPNSLPLAHYIESQQGLKNQIGTALIEHIHAICLLQIVTKDPRFDSLTAFYSASFRIPPYVEAIGNYVTELSKTLKKDIAHYHLLLQTVTEQDLQGFKHSCLKTESFLRWFSHIFLNTIQSENFSGAAHLLHAVFVKNEDAFLWFQWAFQVTPSSQRESLCHYLILQCPVEKLPEFRSIVGQASLPISDEDASELETIFPSDSRDLFMWGNTVHYINAWATQTRTDLLKLPSSLWEMLYRTLQVHELTDSQFFQQLLNHYGQNTQETLLIDSVIRILDNHYQKKSEFSSRAYLSLLAFSVFFKQRNLHSDYLIAYFSRIERLKTSVTDLLHLLETPPLDATSYPRWLHFVLDKINQEFTGLLLTQPVDLVAYVLSDKDALRLLSNKTVEGTLLSLQPGIDLFSKLAILTSINPTFFKQAVEGFSSHLTGETKQPFLDFISHRQLSGNTCEKNLIKAIGHFVTHSAHTKNISRHTALKAGPHPLFALTDYFNHFFTNSFRYFCSPMESPAVADIQTELRTFLSEITPSLLRYVTHSYSETIQRLFKTINSPTALQSELSLFWSKTMTPDSFKQPTSDDILVHTYGFLAQCLLSQDVRVLRVPISLFTPALYADVRLVLPQHTSLYVSILHPFLNTKDNPILTLRLIASLIPDPSDAKHHDMEHIVNGFIDLIPTMTQCLQLSHGVNNTWLQAERTALARFLYLCYAFLLHQPSISSSQTTRIALPLFTFTAFLQTKGKLLEKPAFLKNISPQSLLIDSEPAIQAFETAEKQFQILESLIDILDNPPSFKGKSFSKLTSTLLSCFETMPDTLYALKTQRPQSYMQLLVLLSQLETHFSQKDPKAELFAYIQLHFHHLLPDIAKNDASALCELLQDYLQAHHDENAITAISNRFFGESHPNVQVGFLLLHTFDFHLFNQFAQHRATTIQGLKMTVFAQKLKYNVLLQLFTHLLSSSALYHSAIESDLLVAFHTVIRDLRYQQKHDFESIYRTTESVYRFIVKDEPFLSELLYIRQLILSHKHDFLATGLFSQETFNRFTEAHTTFDVMTQLFFIIITLYIQRLDVFKDTVLSIEDTATTLGKALLHYLIFSHHIYQDTPVPIQAIFSKILAHIEMLEKHGRQIIAPVFESKSLSRNDIERLYSFLQTPNTEETLKRLTYWLSTASLFNSLSLTDATMLLTLFVNNYKIPNDILTLGFSSPAQHDACLDAIAQQNLYLSLYLKGSNKNETISLVKTWKKDIKKHAQELSYVLALFPNIKTLLPKDFHPIPVDLDTAIHPQSVLETGIKLSLWATQYKQSDDVKSFYKLVESFHLLFKEHPSLLSRLLPSFYSQSPDVFWELIFYHSSSLLSHFVDFLLRSSTLVPELPEPTLYTFLQHPLIAKEFRRCLFNDATFSEAYTLTDMPFLVQCLVIDYQPQSLLLIQNPHRFSRLLAHLVHSKKWSDVSLIIQKEPEPLFPAVYLSLFPDQSEIDSAQDAYAFDCLSLMPDSQLIQCLHFCLQKSGSDFSFVCSTLFQSRYFSTSFHQRSILLSRLIEACSTLNKDRFASIIHDLHFKPDSTTARYLTYSFLLTETSFLGLTDCLHFIKELGFIPAALSSAYHAQIKESFINPDLNDALCQLSHQSSQGFRSLLLLPQIPSTIRTAVKLHTLRPLNTLTRIICRCLLTLLPIEILQFCTGYICHDLHKKTTSAVLERLTEFYKTMQKPTGFKRISESDIEGLKSDILALVNTPYVVMDADDPIFQACLSALRYSDVTGYSVQRVLDALHTKPQKRLESGTSSQQLYMDSHMSTVILNAESRWIFLCYLEREIKESHNPLFTRLIEGWETQYSIWDRYIHSSLSPKETIFSQQFLLKLCKSFVSRDAKPSQAQPSEEAKLFGFLYVHCPTQRGDLLAWLKQTLLTHTTENNLSFVQFVLQSHIFIFEDVLEVLTPLLTHKKGSLAIPILQRVQATPFSSELWKAFYTVTKRPVLVTEICTPHSDFDVALKPLFVSEFKRVSPLIFSMADTSFIELSDFFETWLQEGLHAYAAASTSFPEYGAIKLLPSAAEDPLITLFCKAIQENRLGFLTSLAKYLQSYSEQHDTLPSWLYYVVLQSSRVTASDLYSITPFQDTDKLLFILKEMGILDEHGLIIRPYKEGAIALDRLLSLWENTVDRDVFIFQLSQFLEQRLQSRDMFLDCLASHCPRFFAQKSKKKRKKITKNEHPLADIEPLTGLRSDHPSSLIHFCMTHSPSGGLHYLLDNAILSLQKAGHLDLLAHELKALPLDTVLGLLLYENRHYLSRQHLVNALFSPALKTSDRTHYASTLMKKIEPHLDTSVTETKQVLYDVLLSLFICDSGLFHGILFAYSDAIHHGLGLSLTRLYEARTRILFLIKSQQNVLETLLSERAQTGLNLLEITVAALSLRHETPDLSYDIYHTLHTRYPDAERFFIGILKFIKPGLQIGRIEQSAFDELPNGSDVRFFLQHHHIIDAFGLILIQDFHKIPTSLRSREACISLIKLSQSLSHATLSNDELLFKESEKQWRNIVKFLQNYSEIAPLEFESSRMVCRIFENLGYLENHYHDRFLTLHDLQQDLLSMKATQLARPTYISYISGLFAYDKSRLDRFVTQLPVQITKDDLLKKKIIPEKIKMLLTKLEAHGYLNSQGQLTGSFYSSAFRLSGVDPKETRFWQDFLVSHVHARRRVIFECLQTAQDLDILLKGTDEEALAVFSQLFSAIPRQKWLLLNAILNHPKSVFSIQDQLINRLNQLPLKNWNSEFSPESLQLAAKALKENKISLDEAITTLFQGFKTAARPDGVNRRNLAKLIHDLSSLLETPLEV